FHLLLLLPPPPTSTLFPYTTLFRSPRLRCSGCAHKGGEGHPGGRPARRCRGAGWARRAAKAEAAARGRERGPRAAFLRRREAARDRKSTRLNSSHVSISYAVFCLKK